MTPTERKRRHRQRNEAVTVRMGRIQRSFNTAGADAQALFIKWLRKMNFME